jgi:2-C-methyl-D-erythritol 4-phosphate cytidylyltransferase
MDKYAIIVAGGSGSRMGANVPKQFLLIHNKPVLWYSITAFLNAFNDIRIILVLPEAYLENGNDIMRSTSSPDQIEIVAGGTTRFQSVQNGLTKVPMNCVVFVHDGVRCLVTSQLILRCYKTTLAKGNAIPAISAVDTIRIETTDGNKLIDRTKVKIIQTPQTFNSAILKKAYQQDYKDLFTDDASVVESIGEKIYLVEGDAANIKITHKLDLLIAEQMLNNQKV